MYTVYVLINPENKTYVGCSGNFERRLREHNNTEGKKKGWTRSRGPWQVLHKEHHIDKSSALRREKILKTGAGRDYIRRLIEQSLPGSLPRQTED